MLSRRFKPLLRLVGLEPPVREDVDSEIRFHLAELTELLIAEGWQPDAARKEALRRFGDVDQVRRDLRQIDNATRRQSRRLEALDAVRQDLTYAARGLRRAPGFAVVVILTLALAIGATATMFGIVDRLMLRPPAHIERPEQVKRVWVARWIRNSLTPPWSSITYPAFGDLRDHTRSFAGVAAVERVTLSLGLGAEARPLRAELATGGYFSLLRTRPRLGRFFSEEEDRLPDGTPVAVLSYGFWRSAFAGDSRVLGRTILLGGRPFEIIGVAPEGFTGVDIVGVDLWVPLTAGARASGRSGEEHLVDRGWQYLEAVVRMRDGVSLAQAEQDATTVYQLGHDESRMYERRAVPTLEPIGYAHSPDPAQNAQGRVAAWLFGVTLFVLLIACANVANLVLARALNRRTEIAVRQALGVGRGRLLRQLLTESLLLAGLGAAVGLLLSRWGAGFVRGVLLPDTSWDQGTTNPRVLLLALGMTLFCAVAAGLLPLLRGARVDVARALHGAGRVVGHAFRLRTGLLLVQTTLCTALLIGAGLFVRSLGRVQQLDLGIQTERLLAVSVDLAATGADQPQIRRFYAEAEERVRALPGVAAAGLIVGAPFLGNSAEGIRVPGLDSIPRLPGGGPYYFRGTPGLMEALGVRLLRGRLFEPQDRAGTAPVAVITEKTAGVLWPGEDPIGRCFIAGGDPNPCREVVGVIADVHRQGLEEAAFMLYFTVLDQWAEPELPNSLMVRTRGRPEAMMEPIRRELQAIRPDLPYVRARPYEEILAPHARSWRLGATMFTVFGGLSLVIAAIGLYGVLSYAVTQRSRELGLRSALGATPGRLVSGVVRNGVVAAGAGVLIGTGLVLALGRKLGPLLFHTKPTDPAVLLSSGAAVLMIALLASAVPGRRATRVDPIEALRAE